MAEKITDETTESQTNERPFLVTRPGGLRLRWEYPDLEIAADLTHVTDKAVAEVTFFYSIPGSATETLLLATNRVDFLSPSHKHNLARQLREIGDVAEFLNWERKVNQLALAVLQRCRPDNPVVEVRSCPELTLPPDYVVAPIIYRNLANIIFGDYGSLKSLTAMVLVYIAQLPYSNNKLGLVPGKETATHCLWLDYEGQSESFAKQWTAIQRGFMPDNDLELVILYKPMQVPLADAVPTLQQEMADQQIELLIVDSLGPAAGGNLNDPESAIQYHQGLRTLGGTSLTLAHNSKDPLTNSKSIFGSVFFSNLARSIWQCKADKEPMDDSAVVSLKQVKASLSQLHLPIGLIYNFDNAANIITVSNTDLRGTSLARDLPLSVQIKNILRKGPMEAKEIAAALDAKQDSVRVKLNSLAKKEVTIKQGDLWALCQKD